MDIELPSISMCGLGLEFRDSAGESGVNGEWQPISGLASGGRWRIDTIERAGGHATTRQYSDALVLWGAASRSRG